ncbi:hypothetical protein [Cryobacterium sp. Y29]|uniref:hypothetical protein n=1 Tax=Cryobacterium sp. Y29 TaxID=2048285 RepID=UPI0011B0356E|nr:hypothetical protein [Cryobacterium sp. Y29]
MNVFLSPTSAATIREPPGFGPRRRRRLQVPLIGLGALLLAAAVIVVAISNQAIDLILETDVARFALGAGHHTG